jgi:hypothetical protein
MTAVNELSSDYSRVLTHIGNEANQPKFIRYAKINCLKFSEHLNTNFGNPPRIFSDDELEQAAEWLEAGIVVSSVDASTKTLSDSTIR